MITYQLDENTNSRKLAESCKEQGFVDVWRLPPELKGAKDPDVLEYVLPSGRTLLTNDRQIHLDHLAHIPSTHSGILIVAKVSSPTTIRGVDVASILSKFKKQFPDWHRLALRNSIVEICEHSAQVWTVVEGQLNRELVRFDDADWQTQLTAILARNAKRNLLS